MKSAAIRMSANSLYDMNMIRGNKPHERIRQMKTTYPVLAVLISITWAVTPVRAQDNPNPRPVVQPGAEERTGSRGQQPRHAGDPVSTMRREGLALARLATSEQVAKEIGLSDDQIEALKNGSYELQREEIKLRAQQELAAMEQIRLIGAEEVDEEALMKAVEKTAEISTELAKLAVKQILLVKKTLTKPQLTQMRKAMKKRLQERFKGMRREGVDQEQRGRPDVANGARERSEERSKRRRPEGEERITTEPEQGEEDNN